MVDKIEWEILEQNGEFNPCWQEGKSLSVIRKGTFKGAEFLLFELKQAYYDSDRKGMSLKTISQSVITINTQP